MRLLDRMLAFGRLVATVRAGGMGALLGDIAIGEADESGIEPGMTEQAIYAGLGDYGRPDPPDDDGVCCEVVATKEELGLTVIATRDLRTSRRVNPAVGALGKAHYGGGFLELAWTEDRDGTIVTILAPHLEDDAIDSSHALIMDPTEGTQSSVLIMHREGQNFALVHDGGKGTAQMISADGKSKVQVSSDGTVVRGDGGVKIPSNTIVGDPNTAGEVALVQQVIDVAEAIAVALGVLSTQIMAGTTPPQSGIAGQIADLASAIATLGTLGKATTLKASPLPPPS